MKVDAVKIAGRQVARPGDDRDPAKLTADKRKEAIEDMVDKLQNAIDDGSNFTRGRRCSQAAGDDHAADHRERHVARRPGIQTSARTSLRRKTGFDIAPNDPPEIVR